MRFGTVVFLTVSGLVATAPFGAFAEGQAGAYADLSPAVIAKAKKPKKKCKGSKVPVKIRKRTRCKPIDKAFPKPKKIDVTTGYLQRAIRLDKLKRVRKSKRKAVRKAEKKLLRALPKVLAYIDSHQRSRIRTHAAGTASQSGQTSAGCSAGVGGPSSRVGGVSVALAGENGAELSVKSGGMTVKIRYGICGRGFFYVPECPTAGGAVDSIYNSSGEVVIEVWEGTGGLVSRSRSSFDSKAKARGKVAADAKLDHLDIEYSNEVFIVAGGGIVRRGKSERTVRINMRNGRYDPSGAGVKVSGDADAVAEDGFAAVARHAIDAFREAEVGGGPSHPDGWSTFGRRSGSYCAEAVFSPASGTLRLSRGKTGRLTIHAQARQGGGNATAARWTLQSPENAGFSPASSQDAEPGISYNVTNAPPGGFIRVTARFTSTAGVGENTWTQPTEQKSISKIAGTFDQTTDFMGSILKWSGNAVFERVGPPVAGGANGTFKLSSGLYTVTASGNGNFLGAPVCSMSGSDQFAVSTMNFFSATGTPPELVEPYEYSFGLGSIDVPVMDVTLFACPPEAAGLEGTHPLPVALSLTGLGTSADGIDFSGSSSESGGGVSLEGSWSFKGTE